MALSSRLLRACLIAGALLCSACSVIAAPNETVSASGHDLSIDHLQRIEPALQEEVDNGVRAGFVAVVVDKNGAVYETAVGMADLYNAVPATAQTRFRIASMTKPVVTAAVMQLVDRGDVRLNDPVSRFIPAFADLRVATSPERNGDGEFETRAPARQMTIHDLLTHMSGLGYVFDYETDLGKAYLAADLYGKTGSLAERMNILAALPLYEDPGRKWRYSYATDVAGRVIEVASGRTLEDFLKQNMFEPLGMNDTEFFLDETDFERLAVVNEFDESGDLVRLEAASPDRAGVNDEAFGVMSGGAGLVSTGRDFSRFMLMLLNEGELDGARLLSPATVRLMLRDHVPYDARPEDWREKGLTFGLGGAIIVEPGYFGAVAAKGEWGWSGFWDTWFFITPELGVGAVLLAQTQSNAFTPTSRARDRLKAIVYGALE
ncbi:serine hydrolase domain-containing protein [Hyphococcus sp.]|uniref:serine hydrolase domain-containing protein n=1 Tax=Hyphococcus sp. TaxID=2038636 RepID=UPI003CCC05EA